MKKITHAEREILEILWKQSPLSVRELYSLLHPDQKTHIQSVRTLLDRLINKQVVEKVNSHGIYVFKPLIDREEWLKLNSTSFLQRFFNGSPAVGAAFFINQDEMSKKDITHLRNLIDERLNAFENKEEL